MMDFAQMSPAERLIAEQAVLDFRTLNKACDEAADGKVLAVAEQLAVEEGRQLVRRTSEFSLRQQAEAVEKRGAGTTVLLRRVACPLRTPSPPGDDGGRRDSLEPGLFPMFSMHSGNVCGR
jgi:hypothetical protein